MFQVLDGSDSQYSGMQIGTLQDEEEEGTASSSLEEPSELFMPSALGVFSVVEKLSALMCFCPNKAQSLFLRAALSKPHLFDGRGHNRQGSDCSVDRFLPKDEPAESEPDVRVKVNPQFHLLLL